jgi:hypothetical protein
MNKYIWTLLLFDKAITPLLTEPLYNSFCQSLDLLSNIFHNDPEPHVETPLKEAILQSKTDPLIWLDHYSIKP